MRDELYSYVPSRKFFLCFELDRNLKKNNLFVLILNELIITSKFAELVANFNLIRKRFSIIIITESWLTEKSYLVLESYGYKSITINREGRTRGCFPTEVANNFSETEHSYERLFVKAAVTGSGNTFVVEI